MAPERCSHCNGTKDSPMPLSNAGSRCFDKWHTAAPERVSISAWAFEKIHSKCSKYLLSYTPDGRGELDGCHATAQDVAQAQHLIQRLGLDRGAPRRYVMITIEEVPEFTGKVNEDAIETLVPVIKRYQEKKQK